MLRPLPTLRSWLLRAACCGALAMVSTVANADVKLPSLFGDHMVLQRGQANPVWGWADAGEKVTVTIGDQTHSAVAGDDGAWRVKLDPLKVGGPLKLHVSGKNKIDLDDVLVGEVWVCSGQSNMGMAVASAKDADLEIAAASHPNLRLISVPNVGTQEPQNDFNGKWELCSPQTVGSFSAAGYYFGRQLQETLGVPVGLIDNAWGGSSAEAWVRRDLLEADSRYAALLDRWAETEKNYDHEKAVAQYAKQLQAWKQRANQAAQAGKRAPNRPRPPRNPLTGQHRPANLYNGVLKPILGYGIRGVVWYQGESNAGRAYQYRELFPLMIQNWRQEWGQGDFPFYWVQLADFRQESPEPQDSAWAELREAQTMTMKKLPNTGEAVIIDIGEADDIHPKNKQDVGKRLARWALARDYGKPIVCQSPLYKSMETQGDKIVLTFDTAGSSLDSFDVPELKGFAIAGADKKFVWAQARILGKNQVEVSSREVKQPVAVRYAWADNPVCNLQNAQGLPATPFRTDDWPGVTADVAK